MLGLPLLLAVLVSAGTLQDRPDFQKAQAAIEDLEYDDAVFYLTKVLSIADLNTQDKAEVNMWLGMALGDLGQFDDARENFQDALTEDRDVNVPPQLAPKLKKIFDEEKAKLPPPPPPPVPPKNLPLENKEKTPLTNEAQTADTPSISSFSPIAVGLAGGGLVGGLLATGIGGFGAWNLVRSGDKTRFADERLNAYSTAILATSVAVGVGIASAGLGGAGAFLLLQQTAE